MTNNIYGPQTTISGGVTGNVYSGTFTTVHLPKPPTQAELDTAHQLLRSLPATDAPLPERRPFRLDGRFPMRPAEHFVGRDAALRQIAAALRSQQPLVISTGMGGVGKTMLCVEAAHRFGPFFAGGVFWISCAEPAAIGDTVAAYGGPGALEIWQPAEQLDLAGKVARVQAYWGSGMPCLLIFDNCDDRPEISGEAILRQWLPAAGSCSVLVSSRRQHWQDTAHVRVQPLPTLQRSASIDVLQGRAPALSADQAAAIAKELGDLPLALHLAGSFLRRYGSLISAAHYLRELQTSSLQHPSMQGHGIAQLPSEREPHVEKAFALSFQQLDASRASDALSLAMLARLACCAPGEPLPETLLFAMLPDREGLSMLTMIDARDRLLDLGLLEQSSEHELRLHRLIAAYVQASIADTDALQAVEQAISAEAARINRAGLPAAMQPILAHLRFITDCAYQRDEQHVALLCNELG